MFVRMLSCIYTSAGTVIIEIYLISASLDYTVKVRDDLYDLFYIIFIIILFNDNNFKCSEKSSMMEIVN